MGYINPSFASFAGLILTFPRLIWRFVQKVKVNDSGILVRFRLVNLAILVVKSYPFLFDKGNWCINATLLCQ